MSIISGSLIEEEGSAGEDEIGPAQRPRRSSLPRATFPAAIAILAAVAATFAFLAHHTAAATQDGRQARATAVDHVAGLLSYTPSTVLPDLRTELPWLTGAFRKDYEKLVTGTIGPAATQAEISVVAKVVGAAVERTAGSQVSVLLFINVDTSSATVPAPRLTGSRARVILKKVSGSWLISDFTPLQGATFAPS